MKLTKQKTIRYRARQKIQQLPDVAILRKDIEDLGSPRQVSRAFQALLEEGVLVKIGYGIYVKTRQASFTEDRYIPGGLLNATREALTKLGIAWSPSQAEYAYQMGQTQQVPAHSATQLKKRFRRHLSYRDVELRFE